MERWKGHRGGEISVCVGAVSTGPVLAYDAAPGGRVVGCCIFGGSGGLAGGDFEGDELVGD